MGSFVIALTHIWFNICSKDRKIFPSCVILIACFHLSLFSPHGYLFVHKHESTKHHNSVMRVNNREDISGIIAQRKKEIEEKRDERRKAKEALKALEGSTQQRENNTDGRATATATISSTGEIETTAPVNVRDSNRKEGEKDASNAKPNAEATTTAQTTSSSSTTATSSSATTPKPKKKKTKIDAMTGLECVDLHENCPFWAATVCYIICGLDGPFFIIANR